MENDITKNVTIPLGEFLKIRDDACDCDILLETIFGAAHLSRYDDRLRFDDDKIDAVLRFVAPLKYLARCKELEKDEKED